MHIRITHPIWLFCLICFSQDLAAQATGRVEGTARPGEGATVSLLRVKDSSLVKFNVAGTGGVFVLDNLSWGRYFLRITSMGYKPFESAPFELSADHTVHRMEPIEMKPASGQELTEVTVTARRPMVEVKADRTLINVEAAISNAGATALEVLERSPGVQVDRDGNISLRGKQGVMVMIDGKPSYLSGQELTNLLTSMNANQIDQIELMTNPPARYDAAGNAGVINIKTKKNRQRGWNGNLNLGYGQGRYYKFNNSLGLNYRNEKVNLFLQYNQMANKNFNDLYIRRTYYNESGSAITGYFNQPTNLIVTGANNTLKLGADYYLSKKTTLGVSASGFLSPRQFDGVSTGYLQNGMAQTDSILTTFSDNRTHWANATVNVNMRHQFSKNEELSVDLDHVRYDMQNEQLFTTENAASDGVVKSVEQLKGDLPSAIKIFSAKTDYVRTYTSGLKMEAGGKVSYVETDNMANYYNLENGNWQPDYQKTNHFLYEENINAAYTNASRKLGKWNLQAGLRFENTNYSGRQLGNSQKPDSSFRRSYNNLFPTVYVTYALDSNHSFTANIGRRIDRPAYQQLNPFLFFINKYTYQVGNPYLQPQLTTSIEFTHSYRNILTTTLSHSRTQQYFTQVFRTEGEVTILTQGNLADMYNTSINMNLQLNPFKWWSLNASATGNHRVVNAGKPDSDAYSNSVFGQFNLNNNFKFKKGWSAELSGNYNTAFEDAQFAIQPMGQVSLGLARQVLKGKGTVKVNVRDIFFTQVVHGAIHYQNVQERFTQSRDSRVFNLNFTYRFGKTFSENRRRAGGGSGSADEQRRVGAGG